MLWVDFRQSWQLTQTSEDMSTPPDPTLGKLKTNGFKWEKLGHFNIHFIQVITVDFSKALIHFGFVHTYVILLYMISMMVIMYYVIYRWIYCKSSVFQFVYGIFTSFLFFSCIFLGINMHQPGGSTSRVVKIPTFLASWPDICRVTPLARAS